MAKAEFRSAVIRSYIWLGLVVVGREDELVVDGEDETGALAIVALAVFRGGLVVAEALVETLVVGLWTLAAVCLLLDPYVPPGVVVGAELRMPRTVFPSVRVRCCGIALPDRAEVACRAGVSASRCSVADSFDDGFAFGVSTPPISVS